MEVMEPKRIPDTIKNNSLVYVNRCPNNSA